MLIRLNRPISPEINGPIFAVVNKNVDYLHDTLLETLNMVKKSGLQRFWYIVRILPQLLARSLRYKDIGGHQTSKNWK
jgi:hypothetical protein